MHIRDAGAADASAIAAIYNPYILETSISAEETAVPVDEMARRIAEVHGAGLPWLVGTVDGEVVAYAYATKWRVRHAYRFSAETSVYVCRQTHGRGLGSAIYGKLLDRLRQADYHLAIGGITLPNEASVKLHEKMGYRKVAHFEEVIFKFGRWQDVGNWQLKL